jgi:predicted Zn-dependent protease
MEAPARSASAFGDLHARLTFAQQLPTNTDKQRCLLPSKNIIYVVLLLLVRCPIAARASEPITVIYGRGRESLMNLTMNGQSQLEKGDLTAAQRSLDAVIKADPTFYPAYYIRAEVFLNQRKYQEAIQDCNEALRKDSTFAEAALLRARAPQPLRREPEGNRPCK